jgi:hypothetical protein
MPAYRSKTLAAWLAVFLGAVGAHRVYLHGWRDGWAWAGLLPTAAGLLGLLRARNIAIDDTQAAWLMPLLGLMIAAGMLQAILIALTADERWDARHNPGQPGRHTGWGAVLAAMFALLVGGGVLMATLAFSGERFFEWQLREEPQAAALSRGVSPGK